MFLASPASLKKMRSSASGGFGSPVACVVAERGGEGGAAAAKETMSFSEMFTSSPADLAKMRRSNVGGSERGNSIVAPEVRGDGRARVEAFAGMFAGSPADLAKMRGKPRAAVPYQDARGGTHARFPVVAPNFQAMFTSSPSDLNKMRSGRSSKKTAWNTTDSR